MARRVNYGFEKHQKENKRKKKQAEKLEKKRLKKLAEGEQPAADTPPVATDETPSQE
jgi:hypothetical protein